MTIDTQRLPHLALACLLTVLLGGCSVSRQTVVYYNLTSLVAEHPDQGPVDSAREMAIGVGPISLPESLSRAQIAVRLDAQRLRYDDFNRWSGSLADDFAAVLMDDIAAQLPAQTTITLFPWGGWFQPSHRLVINVSRFDGALNGEVVLKARWTITNAAGKEAIVSSQSTIKVKAADSGYQGLVAAQSQAVADLATEIVTALTAH